MSSARRAEKGEDLNFDIEPLKYHSSDFPSKGEIPMTLPFNYLSLNHILCLNCHEKLLVNIFLNQKKKKTVMRSLQNTLSHILVHIAEGFF